MLAAYDIPAARTVPVARASASLPEMKFPAVLKVDSEKIVHKSDEGGVVLNLGDTEALQKAFSDMSARFPDANFVVQEQCPAGTEIIIGIKREAGIGPVMMFGLGGVYVEMLKDVSFCLAPLSEADAARMVRKIRSFPLLEGGRSIAPSDIAAIEKLLIKVSRMAQDLPEIGEMDLNPVIVYPEGKGVKVVDARIKKL